MADAKRQRIVPLYYEDKDGNKTQIGTVDASNVRPKPDDYHIRARVDDADMELEFTMHVDDQYKTLFSIPEEEYSMGYQIDVETVGLAPSHRFVLPSNSSHGFSMGDWAREVERRSELGSSESEDSQP